MNDQSTVTRRDLVEQNVEKVISPDRTRAIAVGLNFGGTGFSNMMEVIESAKMMSMAGALVPEWLRGNPGACWGIILQAIGWHFHPLEVARMSYSVNGNIGYMSQMVHAVIEARAPLKQRLRCDYIGEGPTRQCVVSGTFDGDDQPQVYTSPQFQAINPKNSPLWKNDPDQQLWYFSCRSWCRRYAPDILMGVYSKDDLEDNPALAEAGNLARDVTNAGLHARLAGGEKSNDGHKDGHAHSELDQIAPASGKATVKENKAPEAKPDKVKPATKKKAEPRPKASAEPVLPDIKTAEDYEAHAIAWVGSAADVELMRAQWSRERAKRTELGVVEEMMIRLNTAYTDKIKALQKAGES